MGNDDEENKRPVAHKTAISRLETTSNPETLIFLAKMYRQGSIVPPEDNIPRLIEALRKGRDNIDDFINETIAVLEQQAVEAEAKNFTKKVSQKGNPH